MGKMIVVNIVPTGVGAAIGGYEGDATPATNAMAVIADKVITHPNVVNGVSLNIASKNVLYVEGYSLDQMFQGKMALREVISNKIGVIIDNKKVSKEGFNLAVNSINALRVIKGIEVIGVRETKKPVGAESIKTKAGIVVGKLKDPKVFLKPAKELIEDGAEAIAICTRIKIKENDLDLFFKGMGPNPYGGVEAIISHCLSSHFKIPCAHAPVLSKKEIEKEIFSGIIDSRAGAEAMGPAYLGSVLQGLANAPRLIPMKDASNNDITVGDISAIVLPYSCMGGIPALAAQKYHIPLIAVKENSTVLSVTPNKLKMKNVIVAENYLEALGIITAMKDGIDYKTIKRPIEPLFIS